MDIQKIITDIVEKVKNDPDLIKKFLSDPSSVLKGLGIDVSADQMAVEHFLRFVRIHVDIGNLGLARLYDLNDRLILAQSDASGLGYHDLVGHVLLLYVF